MGFIKKRVDHKDVDNEAKFITVYTDGSFCYKTKAGGWGVWVRWEGGSEEYSGPMRDVNKVSDTEFTAAIEGLCQAQILIEELKDIRIVVLVTDCQEVQKNINGIIWNNKYIPSPYDTKIKTIIQEISPSVIRVKKVKAHSSADGARSWANNKVDKLAKSEMRPVRDAIQMSLKGPSY